MKQKPIESDSQPGSRSLLVDTTWQLATHDAHVKEFRKLPVVDTNDIIRGFEAVRSVTGRSPGCKVLPKFPKVYFGNRSNLA